MHVDDILMTSPSAEVQNETVKGLKKDLTLTSRNQVTWLLHELVENLNWGA